MQEQRQHSRSTVVFPLRVNYSILVHSLLVGSRPIQISNKRLGSMPMKQSPSSHRTSSIATPHFRLKSASTPSSPPRRQPRPSSGRSRRSQRRQRCQRWIFRLGSSTRTAVPSVQYKHTTGGCDNSYRSAQASLAVVRVTLDVVDRAWGKWVADRSGGGEALR